METEERIIQINIAEEMKTAYIDYSMSVIVSRALPDVRDGLKPVQRRVIYGMEGLSLHHNKSHKKSARIVGEVLGKYHPHGDSSVYEAMVRMAQPWSLRYPLVDGQGNFGSVDGDSPAAMRYTEARLKRVAGEIIEDMDKETVDYQLNFDDSLEEPTVLPSRFPALLVNGASGIAVGMATNMLPHNLTEIINGIIAYIDNSEITIDELCKHVTAPDFPTGGIIYGYDGVKQGFHTGRGRVVVRGKAEIEAYGNNRERIIVTEIPYQINKSVLIKKTADLINAKKIEGISDIRDESDRNGMRIVYELKKDANASWVLNQLYKMTYLQSSYGINNVCLVKGRPRLLNLKELITYFVEFRHEVVVRRTEYDLRKALEKAHILEGLLKALDHMDEVIRLIRASKTPDIAKSALIEQFEFTDVQAKAILDMRLQKLTGLEREKLSNDYNVLMQKVAHFREILGNLELRMSIIKNELLEIQERYGDERRTDLVYAESDISLEDIIERENVAVTISHLGYIKRTSLADYREQNRGGKGSKGSLARNQDFIENLFIGSTHDYLLVFTERGKCFWLKVYEVPEGSKVSKGRAVQNIIDLPNDDKVMAYLTVKNLDDEEFLNTHYIVFSTKKGMIKKTSLKAYSRPRQNGIIALSINDNDDLLEVKLTNGNCDIMLGTSSGRAIRFEEKQVRPMGRGATGVRGIRIKDNGKDEVIGMVCIDRDKDEPTILTVSQKGYGKRTALTEYRSINRGGKGVTTMNLTEKTGELIALKEVTSENGLMIINKSGITIRMGLDDVAVRGRNTQGVKLIDLRGEDEIASVAKIPIVEEEEETAVELTIDLEATENAETTEQAAENTVENVSETDNAEEETPNTAPEEK
ncbi:MAG: DNA gyrase subunit A [Chitinophagales bacterium]